MRAVVLSLMTAFFCLMVTGVFVLDWFVIERSSVDLWAVARCNQGLCVSRPIETLATFHPFAITTLWITAIAVTPVIVQTGAYLVSGSTRRHVLTAFGYAASVASMACVLITAYIGRPTLDGQRAVAGAAPLVVVTGLTLGMIAMHLASKRVARIPVARAVR